MSKFNAVSAGIMAGAILGALALPAVTATAQPVPGTGTQPVAQNTDESTQVGTGSSFSGPGLTGSSTTGSSGSFGSSGSSAGSTEGAGGLLGRLLRGMLTGS